MAEIPGRYRPALIIELEALVRGARPDLLTWVRRYGPEGARLIAQPEAIWTHHLADLIERPDGSAYVALPLWTTTQSPSDLTAEFEITADGDATITDVHVL